MDRYVGVYEHQLLPNDDEDMPWLIGRRRVLIDHSLSPVELIILRGGVGFRRQLWSSQVTVDHSARRRTIGTRMSIPVHYTAASDRPGGTSVPLRWRPNQDRNSGELAIMPATTGMKGAGYYDLHSTAQLNSGVVVLACTMPPASRIRCANAAV